MLALAVQIVSMFAFIAARDVGLLYFARGLQGVATGLATGTITAWLLDLQPPDNPRLGSLMGSVAPMAGLAGGALLSGLLVQYGPDPLSLVFWLLAVVFIIALAVMPTVPDVSARTPGWFPSLKPHISIPAGTRSLFVQVTPSLIAAWAMSGLYLSIGPSLVLHLLQSNNHFVGSLVVVTFSAAGVVGSLIVRALNARLTIIIGSIALTTGVGVSLLSITIGSGAGFFVGSLITGLGFGPAFSGAFRSLAPLAPPDRRGSLLSSIFVVSYLAFGIPAVIAGVAITFYGLTDTTYVYGLVVMVLAAVTTIEAYRTRTRTKITLLTESNK
jgi:MFS family permease